MQAILIKKWRTYLLKRQERNETYRYEHLAKIQKRVEEQYPTIFSYVSLCTADITTCIICTCTVNVLWYQGMGWNPTVWNGNLAHYHIGVGDFMLLYQAALHTPTSTWPGLRGVSKSLNAMYKSTSGHCQNGWRGVGVGGHLRYSWLGTRKVGTWLWMGSRRWITPWGSTLVVLFHSNIMHECVFLSFHIILSYLLYQSSKTPSLTRAAASYTITAYGYCDGDEGSSSEPHGLGDWQLAATEIKQW